MAQDESFRFVWNDPRMLPSASDPAFDIILREQLPWILQKLGTWTTPSLEQVSVATLLAAFELPHEIIHAPIIFLRGISKEWNFGTEISC